MSVGMSRAPADPGLTITGGRYGIAAHTEELSGFAVWLQRVAVELLETAALLASSAGRPGLVLAGSLDPTGAVRVHSSLTRAVGRLLLLGSALAALARGIEAAAVVYALAERDVSQWVHDLWQGVGPEAARPLLLTSLAASAGWVEVRAAQSALGVLPRTAQRVLRGDDPPQAAGQEARAGAAELLAHLTADGTAVLEFLLSRPELARESLATLPMLVPAPLLPTDPQGAGNSAGAAGLTALAMAVGRPAGLFVEGRVTVGQLGSATARPAPSSAQGLLQRLSRLSAPRGQLLGYQHLKNGVIVDKLATQSGPPRWIVYVPPTNDWGVQGSRTAFDMTANMGMVAKQGLRPGGDDPDAVTAAVLAMHAAGIAPGEPVMLVGFSQGGLTAASIAADPELRSRFDVRAVVAAGSPISEFEVPDSVDVLTLENDLDPVPKTDGSQDADRPNWVSVRRATLDPEHGSPLVANRFHAGEPFSGHYLDGYIELARLIDDSPDPSVAAWRTSVAGFLSPGADVTTTEFVATRNAP